MNRREAIERVALLMGGAVIGGEFFLSGCQAPGVKTVSGLFEPDQQNFLGEVAETILPKTSTPGAKEAGVGQFMAVMVRDCYKPEDQDVFLDGIKKLDEASVKLSGKKFLEADQTKRTELLINLDKEQKEYTEKKKKEEPNHYFRMMKELTLLGYFTSELGATKALRYLPVPGKYDGNYPYKKGDKAWAL